MNLALWLLRVTKAGGSFYHCMCRSLVFCLLAWVIPHKWNRNAWEAWHCGSREMLLWCEGAEVGEAGRGFSSALGCVLSAVPVGGRAQWRSVRLSPASHGYSLFIDTTSKKECTDILQNQTMLRTFALLSYVAEWAMIRHPELMRYLVLRVLCYFQAILCRPWKAVLKESFSKLGLQLISTVSFFLSSTFILWFICSYPLKMTNMQLRWWKT